MTLRPTRTVVASALALTACLFAWACESSGGGGDCFPPEHGPSDPSCAGFVVGLSCPVGIASYYTCVCTQGGPAAADAGPNAAPPQTWVCTEVDGMSGAGGSAATGCGGGSGGAAGTGGTGGKAGTGGSGAGGGM